jgi:acyl-CoA thioesterase FadM
MEYVLVSAKAGVVATGEGIVVAFDYRNGKKAEVPPRLREALEFMEGKKL